MLRTPPAPSEKPRVGSAPALFRRADAGRYGARARAGDVDADVDAVAHGPRENAAVDMALPRL